MSARSAVHMLLAVPLIIATTVSPSQANWPLGGEPVCVAPCDQVVSSSVSDGYGGMYLAWDDNRSCGNKIAYIQHIDRLGAVFPGWPALGRPVCNSTVGQTGPLLVPDGHAGAIVVWRDFRADLSIFAARFAPDGTPLWDPAGIAVCDAGAVQDGPSALSDGAGGVYVTWMDNRLGLHRGPPSHDLLYNDFAQHISASGARAWGALGVPVSGDVVYQPASVLSSGSTGTLITWNGGSTLSMQRLDAAGSPLLGINGVSVAGFPYDLVVPDGVGGVIGASGLTATDGGSASLRVQRTDGSGALLWGADGKLMSVVVSAAGFDQRPDALVADGAGGAYVAWTDRPNGVDRDVYLQHVDGSGNGAPGWPASGIDLTPVSGSQVNPQLLSNGSGGCIAAWDDTRLEAMGSDVFAQRMTPGGAIAQGWASGGIVVCSAAGKQNGTVLTSDGAGGALIAWQDWRVDGDVYAQRVQSGGVVGDASPVSGVEPTSSTGFAIAAVFPNPSNATALRVSLSLPNGAPARVTLIDAQGRLVARQEVQIAGGGRTTISLSRPERLPPGVYRLRLEQFGRAASRGVSIVK